MQDLITFAKKFIRIPYVLGSFDPKVGLDCATFVLLFFKELDGKELEIYFPADVFKHYSEDKYSRIYERYIQSCLDLKLWPCVIEPLDIIVFHEKEQYSEHVGIYLGNNIFTHCSIRGVGLHKVSLCSKHIISIGKFKAGVR